MRSIANNNVSGLENTRNIANYDVFHIPENLEIARGENSFASGVFGMSSTRNTVNTGVIGSAFCAFTLRRSQQKE